MMMMMRRRTMTATWCWSVSPAYNKNKNPDFGLHSAASAFLQFAAPAGRVRQTAPGSWDLTRWRRQGSWISRILLQQWQWCWWKESYSPIIQLGPRQNRYLGLIWIKVTVQRKNLSYVSFCKVGNLKDHHGFPPRSYHSLHPCIYQWEDRCQICLHRCLPLCSCGAWQWI